MNIVNTKKSIIITAILFLLGGTVFGFFKEENIAKAVQKEQIITLEETILEQKENLYKKKKIR